MELLAQYCYAGILAAIFFVSIFSSPSKNYAIRRCLFAIIAVEAAAVFLVEIGLGSPRDIFWINVVATLFVITRPANNFQYLVAVGFCSKAVFNFYHLQIDPSLGFYWLNWWFGWIITVLQLLVVFWGSWAVQYGRNGNNRLIGFLGLSSGNGNNAS